MLPITYKQTIIVSNTSVVYRMPEDVIHALSAFTSCKWIFGPVCERLYSILTIVLECPFQVLCSARSLQRPNSTQ